MSAEQRKYLKEMLLSCSVSEHVADATIHAMMKKFP